MINDTLFIGDILIETPISSGFPIKTFPYILVGGIKFIFFRGVGIPVVYLPL